MTNPKLTDAEVEALWAEKVMGGVAFYTNAGIPLHPLTSIADAMAGLEAHPEWTWELSRYVNPDEFNIEINPYEPGRLELSGDSLCRLITYACLLAVGACDRGQLP